MAFSFPYSKAPGLPTAPCRADWTLTNTYLYGTGLIMEYDGSSRTYYYQDALGSTRETRNGSGGLLSSYDYKAFGELLSGSTGGNYFRYTGQQQDDESGLYYLRARYYDPTTGRFLTVDPLPAVNPYIYADNRPTASVDPSGKGTGYENPNAKAPWWAGLIMGAGIPLAAMGGAYVVGVIAEAAAAIPETAAAAIPGTGVAAAPYADQKFYEQLERQLNSDGISSVYKTMRSLVTNIAEHEAKLEKIRAAGGYTSSVERELRTYGKQLVTLLQFLHERGFNP